MTSVLEKDRNSMRILLWKKQSIEYWLTGTSVLPYFYLQIAFSLIESNIIGIYIKAAKLAKHFLMTYLTLLIQLPIESTWSQF